MPTLQEWRTLYDGWAGQDPHVASTGTPQDDGALDALAAVLADWLHLTGAERALDVGCASGTLTSRWSPRAREVVGVDFSGALVAEARRRHGGSQPHLSFVQAEAAALPFADATFDRVCCFNVLLSLPSEDYAARAMRELLRVARPGATVVLGSLPDRDRRQAFFDQLERRSPWYRRAVPRRVRWAVKRVLRPGEEPGRTKVLWFAPEHVAAELRRAGCDVRVHADPAFAGYDAYRSTLVLQRGKA